MSGDEERRKAEKPVVEAAQVPDLAKSLFGVIVKLDDVRELDSYDDRNFSIKDDTGARFTFKVHNGVESDEKPLLEAQNMAFLHMKAHGITTPVPVPSTNGEIVRYTELPLKDTDTTRLHAVRLLTWVHGTPMADLDVIEEDTVIHNAGRFLSSLTSALTTFDHPALHRFHVWDLKNFLCVGKFLFAVEDPSRRDLITALMAEFEANVLPLATCKDGLRHTILQADFNDANIIVDDDRKVIGVIDFGDMVHSYLVNEVAIGMAYSMVGKLGRAAPLEAAAAFYQGFCEEGALNDSERSVLWTLVAARLALSHTLGMFSFSKDPKNKYLKLHAEPAFLCLQLLRQTDPKVLAEIESDASKQSKQAQEATAAAAAAAATAVIAEEDKEDEAASPAKKAKKAE